MHDPDQTVAAKFVALERVVRVKLSTVLESLVSAAAGNTLIELRKTVVGAKAVVGSTRANAMEIAEESLAAAEVIREEVAAHPIQHSAPTAGITRIAATTCDCVTTRMVIAA